MSVDIDPEDTEVDLCAKNHFPVDVGPLLHTTNSDDEILYTTIRQSCSGCGADLGERDVR